MTDVVAEIGIKFDKNDIVIVAVAKIEAELRTQIRESKAEVADIDVKIADLEVEFKKHGETNTPKLVLEKQKIFDKAISDTKATSALETGINFDTGIHEGAKNRYTLYLGETEGRGDVTIFVSEVKLYARQTAILKELSSLRERREKRIDDGVRAKKQLQDIPAAERQMKAVVIEHEMNKTKEGKAIINALAKNYLNSMKQIEM